MDDSRSVRAIQRLRDLRADADDFGNGQGTALDALREGFSRDQLHDEVIDLAGASDVVKNTNMRVVQGRRDASFPFETSARVRVLGQGRGQDLDRDVAAKARVARAIDLANPAGAEWLDDLVWSESISLLECHRALV